MCAATDERISTLKSPDCSLSFSYLPPRAKKSFKLAFIPPPLFLEVSSLSLSLLPSTFFSFSFLTAKASTQKTHKYLPVFIHQISMVILFCCFFFCQGK